ncbi:MAG TPA: CARDB domain-containing protein [Terriglobales bacterium]|nr:CARDB domain-containing protein [Terriglobales bacterium]
MRRTRFCWWVLLIVLVFSILSQHSAAQAKLRVSKPLKPAQKEVLVRFRQVSPSSLQSLAMSYDLSAKRPLGSVPRLYHLRSRSRDTATLIRELSKRSDVLYVEPNFQVQAFEVPNDPQFGQQWNMQNTGQSSDGYSAGTPGADISAVPAWDITTGSTAHVVGIVDTGVDYTHPDLQSNIWVAPADFNVTIAGEPIFCPAGTHGFNAILMACDPMDDNMHGTHVSGIIGASGNNNVGVAGVNWTTQIMGLKFLDSEGYGYTSDAVNAIDFAIQAKTQFGSGADVRVLSNSWGGNAFSQALQDEIDLAATNDILFVAAAGNSAVNIDSIPMYPASYNRPNMISVAATDNNDALATFSSYGPKSVHLGAPGVDVLSTLPGATYGYLSGTSMATPHVSGAAALMLSVCTLATSDLKSNLLANVDYIPALTGITVTGGRLNLNHAVRSCNGPVGLSPVSISFGTQLVGKTSAAKTITLTNYQTSTLNIFNVSTVGDFSQTNACGTSLPAKGSCLISVTFDPSSPSAESAQLQVFDDASNSPQSADLSGTGSVAPDLVATSSISVTLVSPGTPIVVNSTVINAGSSDAGASVAGIYASTATFKNSGSQLMGTFNVPVLSAGKSFSTSPTVSIPTNIAAGNYYVLTCADDSNVVAESDETNNCGASSTLQIQYPDMVENSVSFGTVSGGSFQITDTATDQGPVGVPASVTQYYLSSNNIKNTNAILLNGSRSVPVLSAGASSTGTATVTVPQGVAVASYYVLACADDTNLIGESNENNNCAAAASNLQVGPDLTETAVSTSSTTSGAGASIQISDTASNGSAWNAAASFTQYYLSTLSTKTSSARLLTGNRSIGALAAGGTSSGTTTVTVPSDMAVGTYYLLACADDTNLVAETNENNNCIAASSKLQIGPDLIDSGLAASATLLGAGSSFQVSDTTSNQGGGSAAASVTQYYLGPYNSKTSAARLLGGNRSIPALAAGAASAGSVSVTVPSDMATGSYYLLACADDTTLVSETNETNNCTATTAKLQVGPDLLESALSASATLLGAGSTLQITETAINQGGGSAGSSFTQYYLGPYNSKTGTARLLTGNRAVPVLIAGTTSSGTTSVTVPSDMAVGSYYLLACADDTNLVPETNETNNCVATATKLQVGPDLTESSVNSSSTLLGAGSTFQTTDTVADQGGGAAAASFTQYYLGPYNSKTGTARLLSGNRSIPGLAAGATSSGTVSLTVPSDMASGSYYLLACADDTNLVPETNETNNCTAATTKVQVGPDLIESAVSSPSTTVKPGAALQVNDTAINQGGGSAAASVTQYYLGPYNSKTGTARLLTGTRAIPTLAAGANSSGTTMATVPSDMAAGSFYLLACADDTNLVSETSETNNCSASATKIQVTSN